MFSQYIKKMKRISLLILLGASMLFVGACNKDKTTYTIKYKFDNTELQSDFFLVYEKIDDTANNGKWRSEPNQYDTVMIDGEPHEFAYGCLKKEVARDNCTKLQVAIEGYRAVGGFYLLDTVFTLNLLEDNYFEVTPDMGWTKR